MSRLNILITGASKGIGKAIAFALDEKDNNLFLFGRDEEKLNNLSSEINCNSEIFAGDVSDTKFVNESVSEIIAKYNKIDVLVNNAGVAVFKKFMDSSLEEFKMQMNTNVYGIYNFTKAVSPNMIENKKGTIINISSLAGKNGFVYGTMYAATKHAVMGFTRSLMLELREYNIRVVAVCPGSVMTDMISNAPVKPSNPDKILAPEDVASTVKSIIELPDRANISELEIRPTNPK